MKHCKPLIPSSATCSTQPPERPAQPSRELASQMLALEPRYLFDAAGVVTGAEAAAESVAQSQAQAAAEA